MSSIALRQNKPASIELLAGQRQLYYESKRWRSARCWSVAAVAVLGLVAVLTAPGLLVATGAVGAVVAVLQWAVSFLERRGIRTAGNIQEQFDTSVYGLPWNVILAGSVVDREDVIAAAARHRGDLSDLANWYFVPDGVSESLGILLCQRANLRWDAVLRRRYAAMVAGGVVLLALGIVIGGLLKGLSLGEFILALVPLVGAFQLGTDTLLRNIDHAGKQDDLKRRVQATWEAALSDSGAVTTADLRRIQDGIYQLRLAAPPVPDAMYWWKRPRMEDEARAAAQRIWEEAPDALRSASGSANAVDE